MQDKITIADAPDCLNTNDKAMWVLGYQAALAARSTCLHQIQEPAAAEQAAWHAGLDEGREQVGASQRAMVRYCPECSHVGEVGAGHRDCCPDGSQAFMVPEKHADGLRTGFLAQIAQAAPAAVAVPDMQDMLRELRVQISAITVQLPQSVDCSGVWMAHDKMSAALAATPAAAPMAKGYDSGIQTGNRVTLIFETQDAATAWFESFSDAYDAQNGTHSIALPIPLPSTSVCDTPNYCRSAQRCTAMDGQRAAAAPVVLPEPDAEIAVLMNRSACQKYPNDINLRIAHNEGWNAARALLATATGLPAQAVLDRHGVAPNGDKWKLVDGDMRETCDGLLTYHADAYREGLADAPQAQADARDAEIQQAVLSERERICAAIKAEDDHCVTQGDYMLDSDDCIKVARGEWERPVYDAAIAAAKGK